MKKVKLLEKVIADQREILTKYYQKPAHEIQQIFCPYKEVLSLYRAGMQLPDDVTIAWADDNFGYITQLSDNAEMLRRGGSGVYYHLSYWGAPQDYLWLSTISPSLISYEMSKAYHYNAKRLWVFNVGDIKPAEMEMEFSMDLAWDTEKWKPENAGKYAEYWAENTFGQKFAKQVAAIKNEFYTLAQEGKPEHLGQLKYTAAVAEKRVAAYQALDAKAQQLYLEMPTRLKDAFYQLVLYPVQGAYFMNQKFYFAQQSVEVAKSNEALALEYSSKANVAFTNIASITEYYNKTMAKGKWDGMMSWHPRNLEVFKMPPTAITQKAASGKDSLKVPQALPDTAILQIQATAASKKNNGANTSVATIQGLGAGGAGLTVMPYRAPSLSLTELDKAAYVEFEANIPNGTHTVVVKCLPTHSINKTTPAIYAIAVNGMAAQMVNISSEKNNWSKNVINGFSTGKTRHEINMDGRSTIRIYLCSPGVVINGIEVL